MKPCIDCNQYLQDFVSHWLHYWRWQEVPGVGWSWGPCLACKGTGWIDPEERPEATAETTAEATAETTS